MKQGTKTTEEKQLLLMRIQTVLMVVILVLLAVFLMFSAGKISEVVAMAEQVDLGQINAAVTSLKTAADKLSAVDMDALNQGIRDLSGAARDLGNLDFEKLAGFMDSLETLGEQMDAVSGFFKGFLKK